MLLVVQIILSSPRGRAWNEYSPSLGSTMNVAFLAQVYSAYIKPGGGTYAKKAKRYSCWAQTQVRTDVAGTLSVHKHGNSMLLACPGRCGLSSLQHAAFCTHQCKVLA